MSYRTYINGNEWLGNNEMYDEIYDELKRQGCPFDENDYVSDFEVKDLDGLVQACEKVVIGLIREDKSIADFNDTIKRDLALNINLTDTLLSIHDNAYIFIGVQLLNYIGKSQWEVYCTQNKNGRFEEHYRLRENGKCIFSAH